MAAIVNVERLEGLPSFVPPNHSKTLDHKLIHAQNGARNLAIWHGRVDPGGQADSHLHDDMEQVFFVLQGKACFTLDGQVHHLGRGDLILVPSGITHQITSEGEQSLKVLIIMTPPPASGDQWVPVEPKPAPAPRPGD
ncbi:MAG: cupin domain-containing protein [Thermodesulfobacteriota bacterium]